MIICLVTDRRRVDPLAQARAAAAAAIDVIQVRERDMDGGPLAALVRAIIAAVRFDAHLPTPRIVVNERVDVAIACEADGVHLRGDSLSVADARRLGPRGFLVGRSVHSSDEAAASADADYLIAGTVFATPTKPGLTSPLGVAGLEAIVSAARAPVLAIGGVSPENVDGVARAGAAGVAAIGVFADPAAIAPRARALRSAFDTARSRP